MRTKDVMMQELAAQTAITQQLLIGVVKSFDPVLRQVELFVDRPGGSRRYTGLPWPSDGQGTRAGSPSIGQSVVIGFISGNLAVPVILTILSGTGLGVEVHSDLSLIQRPGRLLFTQGLR